MTVFPHTCFTNLRASLLTSWLFWLLFLGVFLVTATRVPGVLAGETLSCKTLDRQKWRPYPSAESFHVLVLGLLSAPQQEVSLTTCWTCGLWAGESLSYPMLPLETREVLLLQRAGCYRALGMRKEALEICRRIIRQYPGGKSVPKALDFIVEILFRQGNYPSVTTLFEELSPDLIDRLLPASRYWIAQSFYIQEHDEGAESLLQQIPADADIYPYALYTLAQIAFRRGNMDQALSIIRVVHDAPPQASAPQMLRELAWLTQARILYQQKNYEGAIRGFRTLSRSSFFLPEALMGMGWCHEGLGDPSKAIAYFQAVESSYADVGTLTEAQLEIARLLSDARIHQDAFELYRSILNDIHFRISQYKRYGQDAEWLNWLAEWFLNSPTYRARGPAEVPVMDQEANLPEEMEPLLEKERYTSLRMKELLGIREGLEEIGVLFDTFAHPQAPNRIEDPVVSMAYPPLESTYPALASPLPEILNLYFALLDTEYRLILVGGLFGLLHPTERETFLKECLTFYRTEFEALILPQQAGQDARSTLSRLQSVVRHLPFSLEEKERLLAKFSYAKRNIEETEHIHEQWATVVHEVSGSETQPTRFLLLQKWMELVRTFLYLRAWEVRSPTVFMLDDPSLSGHLPTFIPYGEDALNRMAQRINRIWKKLALLVKREIENIHLDRLEVLEVLLARTQFDYADALVREQERILEILQSQPTEDGDEETPQQESPEAAE